jgi:hypothetical protein
MRVDVSIGEIIDDAACRSGENRSGQKDGEDPKRRQAIRSDPESPQYRPKQEQNANRLVESCQ